MAGEATELRTAGGAASQVVTDDLIRRGYDDLRRLARARLSKAPPGHTLQPTALVHEVYLRLVGRGISACENPRHFFFMAARAMHDIVVEHARRQGSKKRAGGRPKLDLERVQIPCDAPPAEVLALSEALEDLSAHDPRKHQVVMLRFFADCTEEQTAEALELSPRTVERDWRYARAWLHQRLSKSPR